MSLNNLRETVSTTPELIIDNVKEILDGRDESSGTITTDYLNQQLRATFEALLRGPEECDRGPVSDVPVHTSGGAPEFAPFFWEGRFRGLPQGFNLPNVDLFIGSPVLFGGMRDKNIAPLRFIQPLDFGSNIRGRKVLCEWRRAFGYLVQCIRNRGFWKPNPSVDEVNAMFRVLKQTGDIDFGPASPSGRKRRSEELSVKTIARLSRQKHLNKAVPGSYGCRATARG
eukprot:Plantae.Rhodophyta-Rhodochaete_pulchella.ctg18746.p1 GENE.Plantae.Rhodophyta-Rhodochaete_pulchella.ctg18746~~Plantae.Rhodophyta-Rhodochaete_pulchella.ctg18746.p1  ORF type:complete len:227 (-),score=9.16 Plantae.Rhodophyta-Rhodochaete_pulchella.ctg18746:291-971(-)